MTPSAPPAPPPKPSVWTNPNFWVTQIGAIVTFLVALAGVFHWNASYSGLLAQITVPVAFVVALAFEIAWVIHHDGISRLGLDTVLIWLKTNLTGLHTLLSLVAHVPTLAKLAKALDSAGVQDVEQFIGSLAQHLVAPHEVPGTTGTAVLSAPLAPPPSQPTVIVNVHPQATGVPPTVSVADQSPAAPTEAPDVSGNPPGGGTAHAGIDPTAPPPPPVPPVPTPAPTAPTPPATPPTPPPHPTTP